MVSNHGTPAQGSRITIFYPFYSRAYDVIFFESKWDKKSTPGNPAPATAWIKPSET